MRGPVAKCEDLNQRPGRFRPTPRADRYDPVSRSVMAIPRPTGAIQLITAHGAGEQTAGIRLFRLPGMRRAPCLREAELVSIRCLLVDDNRTFLETARGLLDRQGVTVAGVASSTAEALRQAAALRPDVAVVDIGLGDESGFDLARRLAAAGIAVILISTRAEADYADLIRESPAAGFLPKAELSAAGIRRLLGQCP